MTVVASAIVATGLMAASPAALAQEDDDDGDDDENSTPAPSGVDTGGVLPSDNDTTLLISAGALTALAGGAFALRRRDAHA